jgi:hypothetical protein
VGIYRGVIDTHFVVEVRTSAAAALTDESDGVAAMHVLACHDGKVRQMAVAGGNAVAVVYHDGPSVAAHEICKSDHPIGWRHDGLPVSGSDIDAAMESALAVERIDAFAKRAGHGTFNRPEVGS